MWDTKVSYCHATFRPWIGCSHCSPGCIHCHDERLAHRRKWAEWGLGKPRKRTSESTWKQPLAWNRKAEQEGTRYRVLTLGGDPFDEEVPDQWRSEFFKLIRNTQNLIWLVLTKRPKQIGTWLTCSDGQPIPNVWLGLTVCNQQEADEKIPVLLSIPAAKYWISYEPALGPVYFKQWLYGTQPRNVLPQFHTRINWIVCGGDSGPGARLMHPDWARSIRDQCKAAGVPFFFKQWGQNRMLGNMNYNVLQTNGGNLLDGQKWEQIPE